jgi:DNA-binding beta-propeller fold protein YncE
MVLPARGGGFAEGTMAMPWFLAQVSGANPAKETQFMSEKSFRPASLRGSVGFVHRTFGPARFRACAIAALVLVASSGAAQAASPCVAQKGLPETCVLNGGAVGCSTGFGMLRSTDITISHDGETVYVAGSGEDSIAVLDRDPATGELAPLAGTDACVSSAGATGCGAGRHMDLLDGVVVSPDDENVYGAAAGDKTISVFDRNTTTGAISQKVGTNGCISSNGFGDCTVGRRLTGVGGLSISPDGANL